MRSGIFPRVVLYSWYSRSVPVAYTSFSAVNYNMACAAGVWDRCPWEEMQGLFLFVRPIIQIYYYTGRKVPIEMAVMTDIASVRVGAYGWLESINISKHGYYHRLHSLLGRSQVFYLWRFWWSRLKIAVMLDSVALSCHLIVFESCQLCLI